MVRVRLATLGRMTMFRLPATRQIASRAEAQAAAGEGLTSFDVFHAKNAMQPPVSQTTTAGPTAPFVAFHARYMITDHSQFSMTMLPPHTWNGSVLGNPCSRICLPFSSMNHWSLL